jgi:hypothetical protein
MKDLDLEAKYPIFSCWRKKIKREGFWNLKRDKKKKGEFGKVLRFET